MGSSNVVKYIFYNATLNVAVTVRGFENGTTDDIIISHITYKNILDVNISPVYCPFKEGHLYTYTEIVAFASGYGYTLTKYLAATGAATTVHTATIITFHVTAASGGANLENASVTFNGETKLTSSAGLAVFSNVREATLPYTVSLTAYVTQTSTQAVTVDYHKDILLVAS